MTPGILAAVALVTTIAGTPGVPGSLNGAANSATFNKPTQIAVDRASGDVYVVDRVNNAVRKISGGTVSTFVASQNVNFGGPMNGGIVIEPPGDYPQSPGYGRGIFVASSGAHIVLQADLFGAGLVHDLPWVGVKDQAGVYDGFLDAFPPQPVFNQPTALAIDRRRYLAGTLAPRAVYVADTGNGAIRKITRIVNFEAEYFAWKVETVARGFFAPRGLAFAPDGSLWVTDAGANNLARIAPDGTVTTIEADLSSPTGIDIDDAGNVYIADTGHSAIRRLRPDGVLETVAGVPGVGGYADGWGNAALFNGPVGLQLTADGSLIVADTSNHVIRKIAFVEPPAGTPRRRGVRH